MGIQRMTARLYLICIMCISFVALWVTLQEDFTLNSFHDARVQETMPIRNFFSKLRTKPDITKNWVQHYYQVNKVCNGQYEDNWRNLTFKEARSLSGVGRKSYLDSSYGTAENKSFTILIWKHGKFLERRHIRHFTSNTRFDPFAECSVSNCRITYEEADTSVADAVVFFLGLTTDASNFPYSSRRPDQRWVWLTDEAPYHTLPKVKSFTEFNGVFNWSMNYRMDADVPVPYGRALMLDEDERRENRPPRNYAEEKTKFVAIMISNCGGKNHRLEYLKELQRYLHVDVYGTCGTLRCPGHFADDCPALSQYKFYLAFENSNCREYVTEKVWWNAFSKDVIPVILGVPESDASKLLPPGSYINVRDFDSPRHLANYLLFLDTNPRKYNSYFIWKKCFKAINEHGYFQSSVFHYCRLCEALNYNDPSPKVYTKLEEFWSIKRDCSSELNA